MKSIRISRRLGEILTVGDMERAYANGYSALCASGRVKKLVPERWRIVSLLFKDILEAKG